MEYSKDEIIKRGFVKIRVKRAGMLQQLSFSVKKVEIENSYYNELYSPRLVELSEIERIADLMGMPVEAGGKRAFPKGKTALDFIVKTT
ncbi:MAG: hypothetical protein ACP5RP_00110 [Candidatus Micrarchaeia archaeon]